MIKFFYTPKRNATCCAEFKYVETCALHSTKASVSIFGASNLPPPHPQFPCIVIDCLVNTENGYAYWKQVAFSLLNWSVTAKKSLKREMLFPWFSCFQWNSPSVHRSAFRSNYEIRSRRNMYYFSRVSTDVSETSCCDTISCNVPVSLMRSAVYPP